MEYIAISDKEEILTYKFLPPEVIRQVQNHDALATWSYYKTTPVSCAIFTQKDIGGQIAVVLQFIGTAVKYRHQGMARRLLNYTMEMLKEQEVVAALTFSQGEYPDDPRKKEQDQFLQAIGFKTRIEAYRMLEYKEQVLNSDKLKPYMNTPSNHLHILTPELQKILLKNDPQMETRLLYYLSDPTASPHSLVYVNGNSVQGAVILDDLPDYRMCIRYLYINPKAADKTILMKLLAGIASRISSEKKEGNILVIAPEERIERLMEYIFGKPNRQYHKTMYILQQ